MAIVIPSSKTYNKQNPKVRDNAIERIEVNAQEVVPDNEYETPVFNKNFIVTNDLITNETIKNTDTDAMVKGASANGLSAFYISAAYVGYLDQKTINLKILIPVILINKYIDTILTKTDNNGNENIGYSLFGVEKTGPAWAEWDYTPVSSTATIVEGEISYSTPTNISEQKRIELPEEISITENSNVDSVVVSTATQNLTSWGNLKTVDAKKEIIDGKEYFTIELQLMGGVRVVKMTYYSFTSGKTDSFSRPEKISFEGEYTLYEPSAVEISIRGNTIGIDLQDQTVYINGETAKKVHSVDGNELMQTTNYIKRKYDQSGLEFVEENISSLTGNNYYVQYTDGTPKDYDLTVTATRKGDRPREFVIKKGEIASNKRLAPKGEKWAINEAKFSIPQIQKSFGDTQEKYEIGKETATIRCSIADYFDGDEKVISIDNSTGKMSFKMYDQVIPMVYGSDGKDRPMSLYKDGSAKVFKVLGSKIYYDGAVWQELSLQEIDKSEIL